MVRNIFVIVILAAFAVILGGFFLNFTESTALSEIAARYASKGPDEVGAANLVTAVVVTYRGLDTLGEVTILFLTAAIIGFLLKSKNNGDVSRTLRKTSELLQSAAYILVPVIVLYGVYVFINGHLTPGGGFQGGAIVASAVVLMVLANPERKFSHSMLSFIEGIAGIAFVVIGVLGIVLAGGFLDNSILPMGEFGTLFSAGAIPVIYTFVGLKVGAELSGIVVSLQESQNQV